MNYTFSIIITSRNRVTMLKNLLADLEKQTYKHFATVVVDDASTDATKNLKSSHAHRKLSVFHSKENLKMVKARNKGLALSNTKTEYVLIIDDDNRVDSNFLERINTFVNLYKNFGIIGFKNFYRDKKTLLNCGCNYDLSVMFPKFVKEDFFYDYIQVDAVVNAFLIKRSTLKKIKRFDSRFVIDFSETELCLRAKRYGLKTVTANIPIYHQSEERDFLGELIRRAKIRPETYFYTFRNKYVIVLEFGTMVNKLLFFCFFQFVTLTGYFYVLLQLKKLQYFGIYFRAFFAGNYYLLTRKLLPYEKSA